MAKKTAETNDGAGLDKAHSGRSLAMPLDNVLRISSEETQCHENVCGFAFRMV
jgi:hypothetical protein